MQFGGKLGQTVGQLYDWQRNGIHGKPEGVHFDIYLNGYFGSLQILLAQEGRHREIHVVHIGNSIFLNLTFPKFHHSKISR